MIELVYTSVTETPLEAAQVKDILETSQRNNPANDITGLLCYDGKRFLQILEGSPENIHDLYARIFTDTRHSEIELLHEGEVEDRTFADWRMAYEAVPDGMLAPLSERMAVISFEEADELVKAAEDSFGARMFALFMQASFT